eukprot:16432568-Heterocapsa_arctica.AAC.1
MGVQAGVELLVAGRPRSHVPIEHLREGGAIPDVVQVPLKAIDGGSIDHGPAQCSLVVGGVHPLWVHHYNCCKQSCELRQCLHGGVRVHGLEDARCLLIGEVAGLDVIDLDSLDRSQRPRRATNVRLRVRLVNRGDIELPHDDPHDQPHDGGAHPLLLRSAVHCEAE